MSNIIRPRRILLDLAVSLDGFIEGENGEIDWCIMEPEMGFHHFLNQIDTIFYGRKSYELWGQITPEENDPDKELREKINSKAKYVFSRQKYIDHHNVIYINDHILDEVMKIKNTPGKDIWLYGGASLITDFVKLGLVDEFRLSVHPVILGKGKPLFTDLDDRLNLNLVETKKYSSGVVQLIYHVKGD
ncbi:dihydrofolate reductase family protein [Metabacillus malikii]|uniref:Dihydrofolate reductase n=1 Tax=Metabacillus malikii TaxID=1504265 RepID=A0ABT9ZA43_9BACI|nr:dihydrofolate reductase family protein [Metabacillus malikii]MDQ0229120.1 dihydrofolate reductase [Metabacillus malikii]